tara:strand:+ start:16634 stop:17191 length:558 start_codon:yes stop_codon:yes gene_type:complete
MGYSQLGLISKPLSHKVTAWELISAVRVDSGMANKPSEIVVDVQGYTFVYCQWYIQNGDGSTVQPAVTVNASGANSDHNWSHIYSNSNTMGIKASGSGNAINLVQGILPTDGWGVTGYFLYAKPLATSEGHLVGFAGGDYGDADNYPQPTVVAGIFDHLTEPMTVMRFPNADDYDNFSAQLWGVR